MGTQTVSKSEDHNQFGQCQEVSGPPQSLGEWIAYRRAHPIVIPISERTIRISALVVAGVLGVVMSLDIQGTIKISEPAWTMLNAAFAGALYIPLQRATVAAGK